MTTETTPPTGTWTIDPGHSDLTFTVRHMMIANVRGGFSAYSGTITVADDLAKSGVTVEIDVDSLDSRNSARDEHLRSSGFFDVENHPKITFSSTEVRPLSATKAVVVGDLTVRGKTRPVELTVEHTGVGADPWGNTRAGFVADTTVDRRDFGLDFNVPLSTGGVLVGNEIAVHMEIEAQRAGEEPSGS